eukprot:1800651-Rhodomonas_salina.3
MTRPDLAFAHLELSKFVQYPGVVHLRAAECVLQYLSRTYDQGLTWSNPGPSKQHVLQGWVDLDYASDPDTRRCPGSADTRPVSCSARVRQSLWQLPCADKKLSTCKLCSGDWATRRLGPLRAEQHIDTCIYFIRDLVQKVIQLVKCTGTNNVADALTKSLPLPSYFKHCVYLWGSGVPFSAFWVTCPEWVSTATPKQLLYEEDW